ARADVILDRAVVDVLLAVAEIDAEHLRAAAVLGQERLDLRAREARAKRAPDRLQVGPTPDPRALNREVRDAVAVLLERDVPDPRAGPGVDLDDRVAQRPAERGRAVAVDQGDLGLLAHEQERPRENRRVLGVDPRHGLDR